MIEVEDNGPGARDPEKAFESSYSSDHGGSEIGLASGRSIALSHGGTFAITYSCNTGFEGASVTSSCLPNIIAHKGALSSM